MIQRKKMPFYIYLIILVFILITFYFISGLFTFDDVDLTNFGDYLAYIVTHFWYGWYNEKTIPMMALGFAVWAMLTSWMTTRFRNFQPGKEKGAADWADIKDVNRRHGPKTKKRKKKQASEEKKPYTRVLTSNVELVLEGKGKLSNNNMILIGSSGTYKTTSVLVSNVLRCLANYIILDFKGELTPLLGNHLTKAGYTVKVLNFAEFDKSMTYNPFVYIEKEVDVVHLIKNLQDAIVIPEERKGDPFWQTAPALFLQSLFYLVWDQNRKENKVGSIPEVIKYANMETLPALTTEDSDQASQDGEDKTQLQVIMDELLSVYGPDYPPVRDYLKVKVGAQDTVRSIVIIVMDMLKLFEVKAVRRIFQSDQMRLQEFAYGVGGTPENMTDKKSALFIIIPEDKSFNFICSMIYTQTFDLLMHIGKTVLKDRNGALPIPLEFWMDEFYAGARPADTVGLMGVVRSYNISMIPILQSISQLKSLYPNDKWNILMDNCPVLMFMGAGSGSIDTLKYIKELLDTQTIDVATDGRSGKNGSVNYGKEGVSLMGITALRQMAKEDCIVFMEGEYPIFDRKALPWEMPEDIVPYKQAIKLNSELGLYEVRQSVITDERNGIVYTIDESAPVMKIPIEEDDGIQYLDIDDISEELLVFADLRNQNNNVETNEAS